MADGYNAWSNMARRLGISRPDPNATPRPQEKTTGGTRRNTGGVESPEEEEEEDDDSPPPSPSPASGGGARQPRKDKGKAPAPPPPEPGPSNTSTAGAGSSQSQNTFSAQNMTRLADFFRSIAESMGQGGAETNFEIPPDLLDILAAFVPQSQTESGSASSPPRMTREILEFILSQFQNQANEAADRAAGLAADRAARDATARATTLAQDAATQAAQSVRDEIKNALQANMSEAANSRGKKRGGPPSPVDPTRAEHRQPKRRAEEVNRLQKLIHRHIAAQWRGKGEFGPGLPAQAERVREYYKDTIAADPHLKNNFRYPDLNMLGDAFTIQNLAVDTSRGVLSDEGWNLFMTQYFAVDFLKTFGNEWQLSDVEDAFIVWMKGLRGRRIKHEAQVRTAASSSLSLQELVAQENTEHARAQTRRTLYFRRVKAAKAIPSDADPEQFMLRLVVALDFDGMSDNSVVIDSSNTKIRYIRRPIWRAPHVRIPLNLLDFIARALKLDSEDKRGVEPLVRSLPPPEAPRVNQRSTPRKRLWRNVYDTVWKTQVSPEYVQNHLRPLEQDYPTQFPAQLYQYILSFSRTG